jgi:hypothetical protein
MSGLPSVRMNRKRFKSLMLRTVAPMPLMIGILYQQEAAAKRKVAERLVRQLAQATGSLVMRAEKGENDG